MLLFSCSVLSDSFCDPVDWSTPGLSVLHHLPKFAQVHVYCIGDAIQPSHPLMPSSPSALNLSHHQWLFQWVSHSYQMTKILEFQLQHQLKYTRPSNEYIQGWFPFRLTGLISLLSKGLSGVPSSTTVQRHQFFNAPSSLRSNSHNCTWPLGRP